MTNVPIPTLGPTGFVAPAESDILAGVLADYNAAFGGNLNLQLDTPQGQLATSTTAVLGDLNDLFLLYTNQTDPAYASGRMQDAIARIYFLERKPATATTVTATCSGATGTNIPAGALALSADGNRYVCTTGGTIPLSGSIDLQFASVVTGPITCAAGTLNSIYQSIFGWDSILNAADGIIGSNVESRDDFEQRRADSVALNALGTIGAILGSVLNVSGVLDARVVDNPTAGTVTIGGVSVIAHSIYVSVIGGTDADVATAIWKKKAPGCNYNGNTTVTVYDTNVAYNPPYPAYPVTFERPAALPILFAVQIADGLQVPSTAADQIKAAILLAFYGGDGGPRARIGSTIYASRFYSVIARLGAWAQIVSVKIGTVTATLDDLTVNLDQAPTLDTSDIVVTLV